MIDGSEFIQKIQTEKRYEAYKDIPVVVLSSTTHQREKLYELGAALYIKKPVSEGEYHNMLSILLQSDIAKDKEALRKKFLDNDNQMKATW
jgi:CheY-like chemotaxis protein